MHAKHARIRPSFHSSEDKQIDETIFVTRAADHRRRFPRDCPNTKPARVIIARRATAHRDDTSADGETNFFRDTNVTASDRDTATDSRHETRAVIVAIINEHDASQTVRCDDRATHGNIAKYQRKSDAASRSDTAPVHRH